MKYILYARKSTEQEERQAMSIDSQISELLRMSERFGFTIDKTYRESMSAKKAGRPIFNEMLEYIEKQKDCIVLAWKVDRLTRNISDGARITELLESGNIKEIRTIDKVIMDNPSDKFMLIMDFGVGKKYSDDLSVNVKRGNRAKLEKGGLPGVAPFGYLNDKLNKTVYVDEDRVDYIRKAFDLYSTGSYSVREIADILYASGMRTKGGHKYHKSKIHTMLSNPFYAGLIRRNGKLYQGCHEQVVSQQVFENTQTALFGRTHSKKQKLFFHLRGKIRCGHCGCAFTATRKKGHDYYHCTNGKGGCREHEHSLRGEVLDGVVATVLEDIQFRPEMIEMAYLASKEKTNLNENYRQSSLDNITKQLEFVTKKRSKLLDSHLTDLITNDVYESKMKELGNEETSLKQQFKQVENKFKTSVSTLEPTKEVFLSANRAKNDFLNSQNDKKREVLENLLWNLEIKDQVLANVSYKMPYAILKKSPKNGDFSQMLGRRDSNPRMTGPKPVALPLGDSPIVLPPLSLDTVVCERRVSKTRQFPSERGADRFSDLTFDFMDFLTL